MQSIKCMAHYLPEQPDQHASLKSWWGIHVRTSAMVTAATWCWLVTSQLPQWQWSLMASLMNLISYDGGTKFVAHSTRKLLHDWGIHHRLSSVAIPHRLKLESRPWNDTWARMGILMLTPFKGPRYSTPALPPLRVYMSKPNRTPPQQMRQDWRCCWGPPIYSQGGWSTLRHRY